MVVCMLHVTGMSPQFTNDTARLDTFQNLRNEGDGKWQAKRSKNPVLSLVHWPGKRLGPLHRHVGTALIQEDTRRSAGVVREGRPSSETERCRPQVDG